MSQGDVMELSDRIRTELKRLRRRLPAQYRHVEAVLCGWDIDLASDDYWIAVSRGSQTFPRVYSSEGWEGVKTLIETRPLPVQEEPKRQPLKPVPRPTVAKSVRPASAQQSVLAMARAEVGEFFWAAHTGSNKSQAQPAKRLKMGVQQGPARRAQPQGTAPSAPVGGTKRAEQSWRPDAIAWRQQRRPAVLLDIQRAVRFWLQSKSPEERKGWRLDHITQPRGLDHRPVWAGNDDNYLLLTHTPTGKQWELDLFEDWLKIAKEVSAAAGGTAIASKVESDTQRQMSVKTKPEQRSASGFETCQYCGVAVRDTRLARHLGRCPRRPAHSRRSPVPVAPAIPRDSTARAKAGTQGRQRGNSVTAACRGAIPENLGHADPRDASKYWGHHVRDHGRFGSYPVHDGYGEEADP